MIHRLDYEDYHKVRPLFAELAEYAFMVDSILEGIRPGGVYVDDPQEPQSAMMYAGGWTFLAGNLKTRLSTGT